MSKIIGVRLKHPDIWEEFRNFVEEKRGTKHGIAIELENALKEYMSRKGEVPTQDDIHTRTHRLKNNSIKEGKTESESKEFSPSYANGGTNLNESAIPPSERTKNKIVQYLEENRMMQAESISESAVRRIIGKIAGHDKRTVDKYFHIMEEEELLPENLKITPPWRLEGYPHFKG